MSENYIFDVSFTKIDSLIHKEYEQCSFTNCNFENQDLSGIQFIDCFFTECNLSLVKTNATAFRNVHFTDCKLLGIRFDTCNSFGLSFQFDQCQLNHCSFFNRKITQTIFRDSQLEGVDFSECDLSGALFDNCNLQHAVFDQTQLDKADFRTAYNYSINPEINRMKKTAFSVAGIAGLLDKYDIIIEH